MGGTLDSLKESNRPGPARDTSADLRVNRLKKSRSKTSQLRPNAGPIELQPPAIPVGVSRAVRSAEAAVEGAGRCPLLLLHRASPHLVKTVLRLVEQLVKAVFLLVKQLVKGVFLLVEQLVEGVILPVLDGPGGESGGAEGGVVVGSVGALILEGDERGPPAPPW